MRKRRDDITASEVLAFSQAIIAHAKANADARIAAKDAEIARLRAELDQVRRQYRAYVTSWEPLRRGVDEDALTSAHARWIAEEVRKIKADAEERRRQEVDDE